VSNKQEEIRESRRQLREFNNLDISISPMFVKEGVDRKNVKASFGKGTHKRIYTYAIIGHDQESYSAIDNGHHPWPAFDTYELAEENAVEVCLAYLIQKNTKK